MLALPPKKIFITGTGTGIGKTVVSAILAEALEADYWKPVQAGFEDGTDSEWVKRMLSNPRSVIHPEMHTLRRPASPHIAAREEGITIDIDAIAAAVPASPGTLIIEGAGGLMVPLNGQQFVSDLILALDVPVILVSRNTLGSINHSLLTALGCKQLGIRVLGWIFNDNYLDYEEEITRWSGYKRLASVPYCKDPGKSFIHEQAERVREQIISRSC